MKFEHLVQINDPLNPLIDPLDRNTVWQGLKRRAENPKEFVLALDGFEVLERSADSIRRALTFGRLVIRDEVRFVPQHQVRTDRVTFVVPGACQRTPSLPQRRVARQQPAIDTDAGNAGEHPAPHRASRQRRTLLTGLRRRRQHGARR